jgi:hypothetical protein
MTNDELEELIKDAKNFLRGGYFLSELKLDVTCTYHMIDEKILNHIKNFGLEDSDDDEFAEQYMDDGLDYGDGFSTKLHIALEFLLTGFAYDNPIGNNKKIREAIEGIHGFDIYDETNHDGYIENIELCDILKVLIYKISKINLVQNYFGKIIYIHTVFGTKI